MTMRPCLSLARRLAGAVLGPALLCAPSAALVPAALVVGVGAPPAHAAELPACAAPDAREFPLTARLRGGPESYASGGGYGVWYLDLVNGTGRDCAGVHPVVVLVDGRRELTADQVRLEYYDGPRPRTVRFEETDADELVGPFGEGDTDAGEQGEPGTGDAGFAGFSVPAHRTLTVKLRLSLTSDAVANDVTAHAAVVQRQGGDGEWVGRSNAYRFTVEGPAHASATSGPGETEGRGEEARELAGTGSGAAGTGMAAVAGCLVVVGAGLVVVRRRYYQ
ncbi:hypothetical protein [Streptomyces sp. 4F14]|uniref:hypothetical protein n=1 Tax=Streptomyces sp. 4F14 TaxID=3394380 RepID=UPI003A872DC2